MAVRGVRFEDTCEITGIRNNVSVIGEILKFKERDIIIATIERSAKVTLYWNDRVELYVGSLGDVEFQSAGPKSHAYRTHR
jgi:hypothetical protein